MAKAPSILCMEPERPVPKVRRALTGQGGSPTICVNNMGVARTRTVGLDFS